MSQQWPEDQYPLQDLTSGIIGAAIRVHEILGPGFIEAIYEKALIHELRKQGYQVDEQVVFDVFYDGVKVGSHRADLIVNRSVVLELKAASDLTSVFHQQVKSTLKAANLRVGLLMNFNVKVLTATGVKRIIH